MNVSNIIKIVKERYPSLKISSIKRDGPLDNKNSMHYTGRAVDFYGPNKDLWNLFIYWQNNHSGGLGIGIRDQSHHVHIDERPGTVIWLETGTTLKNFERITSTISANNPEFPNALKEAEKEYLGYRIADRLGSIAILSALILIFFKKKK